MVLNLIQLASSGFAPLRLQNVTRGGTGGGAGSAHIGIQLTQTTITSASCGVGGAGRISQFSQWIPTTISTNNNNGYQSKITDIITANGGGSGNIAADIWGNAHPAGGSGGTCTVASGVTLKNSIIPSTSCVPATKGGKGTSFDYQSGTKIVAGGTAAISSSVSSAGYGNGKSLSVYPGGYDKTLKRALTISGNPGRLKIIYRGTNAPYTS